MRKRAEGIPEGRWLKQRWPPASKTASLENFLFVTAQLISMVFEHRKGYLHILFVSVEIVVLNHTVKGIQ